MPNNHPPVIPGGITGMNIFKVISFYICLFSALTLYFHIIIEYPQRNCDIQLLANVSRPYDGLLPIVNSSGSHSSSGSVYGAWKQAPHTLPLEVRHRTWDSGGDATHIATVIEKQTDTPIKVIIWRNTVWYDGGSNALKFGTGREPFVKFNCPVSNCFLLDNAELVNESDAIVFHMPTFNPAVNPPRLSHHKWVFFDMESPRRFYIPLDNQLFNLTMTYRWDSDIVMPYNKVVPIENASDVPTVRNYASGKTGLVAWMASNCESSSRRANYVKELGRFIKIDTYGRCGTHLCPNNQSCSDMLNKTYKFYLAFENSLCLDYVTEKLFRTMTWDVVPIVLGASNYSVYMPRNSYIDIHDFTSPYHLAIYLKLLNVDDKAYNAYFEWKQYYHVQTQTHMGIMFCSVCHGLHNQRNTTNVVPNIKEWWYSSCIDRNEYFKDHAPEYVHKGPTAK